MKSSIVLAFLAAFALSARAQTGKTTLSVGQGINFATGKVVTTVRKADLSFKYVPPPPTWSSDGKLIPVVDARGEKHDPNSRLSWR